MNRQPNKRRKRKPASGANALSGSAVGGRIKRSPDPQNFTPILGVRSLNYSVISFNRRRARTIVDEDAVWDFMHRI